MQTKIIQWDFDAWEDYLYWQTHDKKMLKKINQLVKDISRNPFEGIMMINDKSPHTRD
jgi:toxin YoeB